LRSCERLGRFWRNAEELESEGAEAGPVETGVMIETPAAAFCAADLAKEAAFFSVGTNDLVQYTLAADRGNKRLKKFSEC
jgi:phosphotransferase system enzyme I (PtsI)